MSSTLSWVSSTLLDLVSILSILLLRTPPGSLETVAEQQRRSNAQRGGGARNDHLFVGQAAGGDMAVGVVVHGAHRRDRDRRAARVGHDREFQHCDQGIDALRQLAHLGAIDQIVQKAALAADATEVVVQRPVGEVVDRRRKADRRPLPLGDAVERQRTVRRRQAVAVGEVAAGIGQSGGAGAGARRCEGVGDQQVGRNAADNDVLRIGNLQCERQIADVAIGVGRIVEQDRDLGAGGSGERLARQI